MAFDFPPQALCLTLPPIQRVDDICFPGGVCLSNIWDKINQIPSLADIPLNFMGQIGPALAPLRPVFNIIDAILAIVRCVQAIPDAITSLDPTELLQCVPDLLEKVNELLKLLPYLSIPKLVKALINAIAQLIDGIAADLDNIKAQVERIMSAVDRAATLNDHDLSNLLACAQATLQDQVMSTAEALRGIGSIILLANVFIGLFGGPEIPCFGDIMAGGLGAIDDVTELLRMMAQLLRELAAMIPDPDYVLTIALGKQQC